MLLVAWPLFAGVVAVLAARSGRSGTGWFLLAMLLSPLLAGVLLLLIANLAQPPIRAAGAEASVDEQRIRCPQCRELVRWDARKCKHCGSPLVPAQGG